MTTEEFREFIKGTSDSDLLGRCFDSDATPFVFEAKPVSWDEFRDALVSGLEISRQDIRIVGSGRFGFSMKPGHNLRSFSDTSDIDVMVVNDSLFDSIWLALLKAAYPRPPLVQKFGGWLGAVFEQESSC
jgi:hypothetical protein